MSLVPSNVPTGVAPSGPTIGFGATSTDPAVLAKLRDQILRFNELTNKGNKTKEEDDEEQRLATSLAEQGVWLDVATVAKLLKGTTLDPAKVRDAGLGQTDPTKVNVSDALNGVLNTNRSVSVKSDVVSDTKRTTTEYVDLPTPDEFLDNFDNAFQMYLNGLVQSGAIRPEVATFVQSMKAEIFGDYLREQTKQLLAGNPLFRVTGTNADEKLIGTRRGVYSQDVSQQRGTEQTSQTDKTTGANGGMSPADIAAAAARGEDTSQSAAGQAIDQASALNETRTTDRTSQDTLDQQNAIIQRNKLAVVANLSPLDFLNTGATAQRLNFLFAGQKGSAVRARETATGPDASGYARRV